MEQMSSKLIDYYKDSGLLLVGLNDSQGVNISSGFFKKGLLSILADSLSDDEFKPYVIDAFSLVMNKTQHVDYFLLENLSLEEIKLSQIYSAVSAFEKVCADMKLPRFFGKLGNAYRCCYNVEHGDDEIFIGSSLRDAFEPIVIYSSGVNDLMREIGANPFGIVADYRNRNKKPNYFYSLDKLNSKTLLKVIDSIKHNYEVILGINSDTDIYTLGSYVPSSLRVDELKAFRDFIVCYNELLSSLCDEYGVTFVDTMEVGNRYNNSLSNFHVSLGGHNALADYILECIYFNKFFSSDNCFGVDCVELDDRGAFGMVSLLENDYEESYSSAMNLSGYSRERGLMVAEEHMREKEIFDKVLKRRKKN